MAEKRNMNHNTGIWNGKHFWCGSFLLSNGKIQEVHTYEEARVSDFHIDFYFTEEEAGRLNNGESLFFWMEGENVAVDKIPMLRKIDTQIDKVCA